MLPYCVIKDGCDKMSVTLEYHEYTWGVLFFVSTLAKSCLQYMAFTTTPTNAWLPLYHTYALGVKYTVILFDYIVALNVGQEKPQMIFVDPYTLRYISLCICIKLQILYLCWHSFIREEYSTSDS